MNFRTRLKKIEVRKIAESFCACLGRRTEIVYLENGKPVTSPEFQRHKVEAVPNVCQACGKPINKMRIEVDFVEPKGAAEL